MKRYWKGFAMLGLFLILLLGIVLICESGFLAIGYQGSEDMVNQYFGPAYFDDAWVRDTGLVASGLTLGGMLVAGSFIALVIIGSSDE